MKRVMMIVMLLGVLAFGGYQIVMAKDPLVSCTDSQHSPCSFGNCNGACHCESLGIDIICRSCPETAPGCELP